MQLKVEREFIFENKKTPLNRLLIQIGIESKGTDLILNHFPVHTKQVLFLSS